VRTYSYIESFNSRVRDECLNINMFWSQAQAQVVISDWKADYNHHRGHSALGYQAPAVYAAVRTHPWSTLTDCGTYVTCFRSGVAVAYCGRPVGRYTWIVTPFGVARESTR